MILKYFSDETGVTVVEYGFLIAGISLAMAVAVFGFGDDMSEVLNTIGEFFTTAFE